MVQFLLFPEFILKKFFLGEPTDATQPLPGPSSGNESDAEWTTSAHKEEDLSRKNV